MISPYFYSGSKEEFIESYLYLVKRITDRFAAYLPAHVEKEELYSYGIFGLLDAVERFSPLKKVKFETYATLKIKGSILDGLRKMDTLSPAARKKVKTVQSAFMELEAQYDNITVEEVARHLHWEKADVEKALEQGNITLVSWDKLAEEQEYLLPDESASLALDQVEKTDKYELLKHALESLSEKERFVIALFYQEELNFQEIAAVLNLTPARISQLHSRAILRLRGKLSRQKKKLVE